MNPTDDPRSIEDVREDNLETMAKKMREVEEKTQEYEYVKIVELKNVTTEYPNGDPKQEKVREIEYVYWRDIEDLMEFVQRLQFVHSYSYLTIEEYTQSVAEDLNSEQD